MHGARHSATELRTGEGGEGGHRQVRKSSLVRSVWPVALRLCSTGGAPTKKKLKKKLQLTDLAHRRRAPPMQPPEQSVVEEIVTMEVQYDLAAQKASGGLSYHQHVPAGRGPGGGR